MVRSEHTTPVAMLINRTVVLSPIQDQMQLLANIVLSGPSTLFSWLALRLQAMIPEHCWLFSPIGRFSKVLLL
jgi:actin-related protein